jgi:hypothetical protein
VEASHALAAIMVTLLSLYPPALLAAWALGRVWPGALGKTCATFVLGWALTLGAYGLIYAVFAALIRLPIPHRFFSGATFTRFFRRYAEPDTTLAALSGSGR